MTNPNDPNAGKSDPRDDWLEISGNEHVNILVDSTFDEFINSKPKVLVMFYAPCKKNIFISFFFFLIKFFIFHLNCMIKGVVSIKLIQQKDT